MDKEKRTRQLAEKFMQGLSSLEEERELGVLLQQDGLPDDLADLRRLMERLQAIALDGRRHYNHRHSEDRDGGSSTVGPVAVAQQKTGRARRHPLRRWLVAAALLPLAVGMAVVFFQQKANEHVVIVYGERYSDREMALKEMQQNMASMAEAPSEQVDVLLEDMFDI